LLASTLAVLVNQAQNAFVSGESPGRRGNAHPNIVPYETFATSDGEIVVAVGSERQWPRFCTAIGAPELADDPRFATNGDRVTARATLRPLIAERLAGRSTAAWLTELGAADVPSGPITDVLTAFQSPEATARSMLVEVEHPALGLLRQAGIPIEFGTTPGAVRTAPPLLGEHTDEVLTELGIALEEVARLRAQGVV
jgi:crotonobetainyl-CoA:carnitine CoA-transferase CaiB-like acyl-CoA transferase